MNIRIKKRDIIILSSIDWNFMWQRHHEVATYFSEHNNVIYVETTAKRNPQFKDLGRILKRLFGKKEIYSRNTINENIKIVSPIVLPPTNKVFNFLNKVFFIKKIKKKIEENQINKKDKPIIIAYLPTETTINLSKDIGYDVLVYDIAYNFVHAENTIKSIAETELKLLKLADVIVADGIYHQREKKKLVDKEIFLVTNGVDINIFYDSEITLPKQYQNLLYYGSVTNKLDFELFKAILEKGYNITIIGDWQIKNPLKDYQNLNIIKPMPREKLVKYIKNADAIIFPYKTNEFNKGVFPVKTYECLALGKPIITTPFEDLKYIDCIYTASTVEEFIRTLDELKYLENEEVINKRKKIALENSWKSKINKIEELIAKKLYF